IRQLPQNRFFPCNRNHQDAAMPDNTPHNKARRDWMLTAGSGLALSALPLAGSTAVPANAAVSRPDVVLVHGAWHGGWCYRRVADILTGLGHRVHTLTLTGLADKSHLANADINLSTH